MSIGKFGFGGDEQNLTGMLAVAGIRTPNAAFFFLGIRTLLSFGPAIVLLVRQVTVGAPMPIALLQAGLVWILGHSLCNFMLRQRAKTSRRSRNRGDTAR